LRKRGFVEFEWDTKKARANFGKHGVSFAEAGSVFGDPLAITFDDPDHSIAEPRLLTFGPTRTGKRVIGSHPERSGLTRIISACLMTKEERKIYEEG